MPNLKKPVTQELAPASTSATAYQLADPFLKVMANPDQILATKGGGNFKVYDEVLRDDQVKSTFQQRRLAVVSAPWDVEPGAEDALSKRAAEELKKQLQAADFDRITDRMLYGIFYGYAVGEILWEVRDGLIAIADIKVRDRSRFRFGLEGGLFLQRQDWSFEQMPDRKFWTISTGQDHDDNPYGVGLAHWLYWPAYFKRVDIKFWLIFLEKFGQPTALGKLPAGQAENKDTRQRLLSALASIATDAAVVIPDGAEIDLLEAARSGAADYQGLHDTMNAAISKVVLSQTMTTDNGSSRSQAEVHEGVAEKVIKADADLICESFNRGPAQWWTAYNFPGAVPPRVWRNTEPEEDLNTRAERDQKIYALGFEPTEDYIVETYGPGWQKKKAPEIPPASNNPFAPRGGDQAEFAENLVLSAIKAGHRLDQQRLLESAQSFANQYEDVIGQRVQQLIDYAETSGDYATFRQHLLELFADQPTAQTINKVERGNFFARLLGSWRAQRPQKDTGAAQFAEVIEKQTELIAKFAEREAPAPVVNVTLPDQQITINVPKGGPITQKIERDAAGLIKSVTTQQE